MTLPKPAFASPAEPFVAPFRETVCDPYPKPGTVAFRDFVVAHLAGRDLGITRPCDVIGVGVSGHWAGRAWDWGMLADDPQESARVDELLDWLLENDAERFRRAGLKYVIWNRQRWGHNKRVWEPYTGPHPHTDHVHFSFGPEGARGETSFFRWLRGDELGITPPPGLVRPRPSLGTFFALAAGAALGFYGARAVPSLARWV